MQNIDKHLLLLTEVQGASDILAYTQRSASKQKLNGVKAKFAALQSEVSGDWNYFQASSEADHDAHLYAAL